ncbi:MAG TPA: Uma2 family endonuclease [Polyangiaceae bacterium]|nr:Uma2 family endonuclease [Polyangiaceae bacterium]
MAQPAPSPSPLVVCYDGPPPPSWDLDETPVPESTLHDQALALMALLLAAWAQRGGRAARVARNLALRWLQEHYRVGLDPDLALYEPPPPDFDALGSVNTWLPGHAAPVVALEVVSAGHPRKDYVEALAKYAASGTGELWVFDPLLAGPTAGGGPYRLQVWARDGRGQLERVYAGPGPVRSPYLQAWLVVTEGGQRLRLADDRAGRRLWPTAEEAERAAKEAERAAKEAERAAKERALAAEEAERAAKERALAAEEAERAAKERALAAEETERAAKERALAAEEAERAAKEAALAENAQLRAQLEALRRGRP